MNILRRRVSMAVVISLFSAFSAMAGDWEKYDSKSFKASQKAGEKILVDVYATWCPTCKAQAILLNKMIMAGKLDGVTLYRVDYDKEQKFLKKHRIPRQSTLLTFHGNKETSRSIAETNPERLSTLIINGLK